jgi:hypothetical protein
LALLTGGPLDLPVRQRTLREAIDWSYELLPPQVQRLLEQLSVFSGGCTLDAAESIITAPAVLEGLATLIKASLVCQQQGADGEQRFTLLETIREYGRDRLLAGSDAGELQHRHADHYLRLAEQAAVFYLSPHVAAWHDRLERDRSNLRSALDWLIQSREAEAALRLAAAMGKFWYIRGYLTEGREQLEAALALPGSSHRPSTRAAALVQLAELAILQGDRERAIPLVHEVLALQRELGDLRGVNRSYWNLARIQPGWEPATLRNAEALLEHALAIARAVEDRLGVANALLQLGRIASIDRDHTKARLCWEESEREFRGLGFQGRGLANCLAYLAEHAVQRGAHDAARDLLRDSLAISRELVHPPGVARALQGCAGLAAVGESPGDAERALRLTGAACALWEAAGASPPWDVVQALEPKLARARTLVGERAAAVWAEGQTMSLDETIAFAVDGAD